MGKRASVVLVAAVAALSACSGGSSTVSEPTTTVRAPSTVTSTVLAPTTTTTTPEYSFDDSVPPPKLVNTGTNYVAILKSLEAYGNWLAAHRPDPQLVSQVVAPGTKEFQLFTRDLVRLRDSGRRATEQLGRPTRYVLLSTKVDAFSAKVIEDIRSHRTVAENGQVASEVQFADPTTYVILVVAVNNRWYFAADDAVSATGTHE